MKYDTAAYLEPFDGKSARVGLLICKAMVFANKRLRSEARDEEQIFEFEHVADAIDRVRMFKKDTAMSGLSRRLTMFNRLCQQFIDEIDEIRVSPGS